MVPHHAYKGSSGLSLTMIAVTIAAISLDNWRAGLLTMP
jgi:hypothetical protein